MLLKNREMADQGCSFKLQNIKFQRYLMGSQKGTHEYTEAVSELKH